MYKYVTLLSKGPQQQLQCVNTLLSQEPKLTVKRQTSLNFLSEKDIFRFLLFWNFNLKR